MTLAEGDALIWRAYPERKTFIDGRKHLFPRALLDQLQDLRKALCAGDAAGWRPLLDRYGVSAIMVKVESDLGVFLRWGRTRTGSSSTTTARSSLFGRADAGVPPQDLAYFKEHRLDAEALAYRRADAGPRVRPASQRRSPGSTASSRLGT